MKFLNSDFTDLEKNGFILKKNILNRKEIDKIKSIILNNTSGKGGADSITPQILKSYYLTF